MTGLSAERVVRARGLVSRTSGMEVVASSFGSNTSSASAGTAGNRFPVAAHSEQAAAAEDAVKEMHWQARRLCAPEHFEKPQATTFQYFEASLLSFNTLMAKQDAILPVTALSGAVKHVRRYSGRLAVRAGLQEAQAAKEVSRRAGLGGALFDFNDSARSLAFARRASQGVGGGACRFLYQTQDPWCASLLCLSGQVYLTEKHVCIAHSE